MLSETPLIKGFIGWLHSLSAQGATRVGQFVGDDTRLRTPEAEAVGPRAIAALHAELFDDAKSVTIRVLNVAEGQDGHTVFLRWDRLITGQNGQKQALSGISEIMVGTKGKIIAITEHWDSVPDAPAKRSYFAKLFNR